MPKAVDVYVLQKKLGSGQFGDVYRGYSKVDGQDVAIKSMRRDRIKGKFTQLLDNEIQVLRSCKNNNIVRLIDIKKTANNIYLVLEYCNEGDLMCLLKSKKKFPQEEALQYFVQILHAFQTLVKNKIMHRDFKLANVLKSDGIIKIADFGFSKLLGSEDEQAETILGSPLNMAPQILDHKAYNSKADIWSIGVAFYEMIFGKVPYSASNIIDLLKKIKKDPVVFPFKTNPYIQDVLKKMLVVDPSKRIEWNDLFKHPVTRLLQDNIEKNLKMSFLCKKEELPLNMSKFYIKTNKVIETVHDICAKKDLNNYVKAVIQKQEKEQYQGSYIHRVSERENKQIISDFKTLSTKTEKEIKEEEEDNGVKIAENTKQQEIKESCSLILHERNVYAFLGHLAQELIETHYNSYYQCLSFLLIKKVITRLSSLKLSLKREEIKGIKNWAQLQKSQQFKQILSFLNSEQQIFNRFYEKLSLKVFEEGTLSQFQEDLMISGKYTLEETNNRIFERVLRAYFARLFAQNKQLSFESSVHVLKLIDSLKLETKFDLKGYDFIGYYQQFMETQENAVRNNARIKGQILLDTPMA